MNTLGSEPEPCRSRAGAKALTHAHGCPVSVATDLPVELDGEAQVGDAAGAVLLHQDVLALQVSVSDGRFPLRAVNLRVQVAQAARRRERQPQQRRHVQRRHPQVVVQGAVVMVIRDQEQLREGAGAFDVGSDEA